MVCNITAHLTGTPFTDGLFPFPISDLPLQHLQHFILNNVIAMAISDSAFGTLPDQSEGILRNNGFKLHFNNDHPWNDTL